MTETPTAAFILSLLGGIFVFIGGFAMVGVGMLMGSIGSLGNLGGLAPLTGGLGNLTSISGSASGLGPPIVALGGVGVLLGVVTIAVAALMHVAPGRHKLWGSLVVGFSVISWVTSAAGLLMGFILALVGGVLAITWKPSIASSASPGQMTRVCPACGTVLRQDMKFCPNCGRAYL